MAGLEFAFFVIIFVVGVVGLIRGVSRELGVSMAMVVLLAVMLQLNDLIAPGEMAGKVNSAMSAFGLGSEDALKQATMAWYLYSAMIVFTAFLAYHGTDTLAFNIREPRGIVGAIGGWLVGLLNGYLIGGGIWFYLDILDYPIQQYNWFTLPLTEIGQDLLRILPQNLFGDRTGLVLSGMALVLLWWRILK